MGSVVVVDLSLFDEHSPGFLVPIDGTDPRRGAWTHAAFVPDPLGSESPELESATYRAVANARAALAALDSTARRLPDPRLLRRPTLQSEAQSTSALEGTYAPLADVLTADEDRPPTSDLREVLNYVAMADAAFAVVEQGRALSVGLLEGLQRILVSGTGHEGPMTGSVRGVQVVIGHRPEVAPDALPVEAARFVPPPPGLDLTANLSDLLAWMSRDHSEDIDPVVSAAMAHYQFETLHPFHDGNGRIGRLLIVLHLLRQNVLSEPTLTVSPWFEARRPSYYDALFAVSSRGDWNAYVHFFATGLRASAELTHRKMLALTTVQAELKEKVRASALRADTAQGLVDFAVGHPSFTVRSVERELGISYGRANTLVGQLARLGVLDEVQNTAGSRRFFSPQVLEVLIDQRSL